MEGDLLFSAGGESVGAVVPSRREYTNCTENGYVHIYIYIYIIFFVLFTCQLLFSID